MLDVLMYGANYCDDGFIAAIANFEVSLKLLVGISNKSSPRCHFIVDYQKSAIIW